MIIISKFLGTCSDKKVADLALKYGRKVSYKYAMKLIKNFDSNVYNLLTPGFYNPWESETNVKRVGGNKYLHIVHSAIDYVFKLDKL